MLEILTNPRCSKCRQALAYLDSKGVAYRLRAYLDEPLSLDELRRLRVRMGQPPTVWMREKVGDSEEEQLRALAERPELLQRPIAIEGERASVVRDLDTLRDFLAP